MRINRFSAARTMQSLEARSPDSVTVLVLRVAWNCVATRIISASTIASTFEIARSDGRLREAVPDGENAPEIGRELAI